MTTTIRLYEATEQLDICRDLLIEAGGELTPEIEELLAFAQDTFGQKAERVALFIQELLATAAAVKQERERLQKLESGYLNGAASLKKYLQREMERAEIDQVKGDLVKVRLQNNPPSVKCALNEQAIADAFADCAEWVVKTVSYRVDSRLLLEYHKQGRPLPDGVTVEHGKHVRIS